MTSPLDQKKIKIAGPVVITANRGPSSTALRPPEPAAQARAALAAAAGSVRT